MMHVHVHVCAYGKCVCVGGGEGGERHGRGG